MPSVDIRQIAILGPGLLGTSLALALTSSAQVRLWGRRPESIAGARERGLTCTLDLAEAIDAADLVIFCTPVETMGALARQIAPQLGETVVLTDVGSVKTPVVAELGSIFGVERFLGSHPMAGSEQTGSAAARAELFSGAACILTPQEETPASLVAYLTSFWQSLGCEVHCLTPECHDRRIALISHLPHLLAGCLVDTVVASEPAAFPLAGQGFRDATRMASGAPEMWSGILRANRAEVLAALDLLQTQIVRAGELLRADDDPGLRDFLAIAKTSRDGINRKGKHGGA